MQELLFAQFLSREECSLCIVAHRVQKYARIAADFGLRSFEVLGFGRATRLVSAMPVLILRLGRRMCGSATKERFGSWFGATFWCCSILSKRAKVEFWRQREETPALDVFKQASSANERRRQRRRTPTKRCGHKMFWRVQGTLPTTFRTDFLAPLM